jgi:hypothetical protein
MKAKLLILSAIVALSLTTPAFSRTRVVQTRNGQTVVTNTGNHRNHWRSNSNVFWNIGIGLPFYGGYPYYSGSPYYGSSYYGYGSPYYGGYPYGSSGYGYYPYGYGYSGNYYHGSSYPYYSNRSTYRGYNGSVVARVQERLARAGYYAGRIDGVIGPRTRYAIRAYERRHGLPADGIIDRRLLATMGIA